MSKPAPLVLRIQAEAAKPQPDQGRMRRLLEAIRSTCEGGRSGNLVATGVVEAIEAMLG